MQFYLSLVTILVLVSSARAVTEVSGVTAYPLVQRQQVAPPAAVDLGSGLSLLNQFGAIDFDGVFPPNPAVAAGPDHLLALTNGTIAVLQKDGALVAQSGLFDFFTPVVAPGDFMTDPRTMFDAGRFWITVASRRSNPFAAFFLLAVSQSADPTGPWTFYALDAARDNDTPTNNFADLPSIGSDDNAIYLTANMFDVSDLSFRGAKIRVLRKQLLLDGAEAAFVDFSDLQNLGGRVFHLQAAQSLGPSLAGFFVNTHFPTSCDLTVWRVTNPPASAPFLSKVTLAVGGDCGNPPNAAQPDTAQRIETGGPRIINAVWRNGSLWAAVAVAHNWGSGSVATARVFQIDTKAFPSVSAAQDFLHGNDGIDVYYPVVSVDLLGNLLVGFNQSSPSLYASVGFGGQAATDPRNALSSQALLKEGSARYVLFDSGGRNRWGDYNAACVDPLSNSFWLMGEYAESPVNRWGTWIGEVSFPAPTPTRTPPPTQSPTPSSSPTATDSPTVTATVTRSPTPSSTSVPTLTGTTTPTHSASRTATHTRTPSLSPTPSLTRTASLTTTVTPTATPTITRQPTLTPTQTRTTTPTLTATITRTRTPTRTPTSTSTWTRTRTPSSTPTQTPTETGPTRTPTPTATETRTPTETGTPTETATVTETPTVTLTPTQSATPSVTDTSSPTLTPTGTPTHTVTATASITPTFPPTRTPRDTLTPTVTDTPTVTPTPSPSDTPTESPTPSSTATASPTATMTDTATETPTPSETPTVTETATETPTETPTATTTDSPTETATPTETPTETSTATLTATDSPTLTPTETPTVRPRIGDLNQDGVIDDRDLVILVRNIFERLPIAEADLNLDGRVDAADVARFVSQ